MATDPQSPLRAVREHTIATLSEMFARDDLEVEEFERRLSLAHRGENEAEIARALAGLTPLAQAAIVVAPRAPLTRAADLRGSGTVIAVMGGADRRGAWGVPERLQVVALMGGSTLDFREARLGPGVTHVGIFAMMGGVHIIVPPTLAIDVSGVGIAGGFEHVARHPDHADGDQPLLVVRGLVMMGGVSVETRLIGEDGREAKRRRRSERKQRRRRLKA